MDFTPYGRKIVNVFQRIDKIYEMFSTFISEKVEVWAAGHIVLWTCLRYWGTPRLNTSMIFFFKYFYDSSRSFSKFHDDLRKKTNENDASNWSNMAK